MHPTALLKQLLDHQPLTCDQAQALMQLWLEGTVPEAVTAGILVALQIQGVGTEALTGFALALMAASRDPVPITPLVDTCGTGGSGTGSFNISTAVAFVTSACGVPVAKHGNRSASGTVGSADVLEYLGIDLTAPHLRIREAVSVVGVTFLFAPGWHPALRHVSPVRKALGMRTVFNLLGPLVNPLAPTGQVLGVYPALWTRPLAEVLHHTGCQRALVLHGQEGLDEAGLAAPTTVIRLEQGNISEETLYPQTLGLTPAPTVALQGSTVCANAQILKDVLQGRGTLAQQEVVALNASAALQVGERVHNWQEGVDLARTCLRSGAAWDKLSALSQFLQKTRD